MSAKKSGFGGGMFGKESQVVDVYLNLTPLMDVMSNILFFLMASFGASVLAVLSATIPIASDSESSVASELDKVTVTVRADATSLSINAESSTLPPEALAPLRTTLPKVGGNYDHAGMANALKKIKDKFPASTTMILVPDDDIRYQLVVKIMDAAREIKLPNGRRTLLFPEVVLSGLVRDDSKKPPK